MVRVFLLLMMLLLSWSAPAQRVAINGTAVIQGRPINDIRVVVNDTVRKVLRAIQTGKADYKTYEKLFGGPDYSSSVGQDGRFRIMALPTDSLSFNGYHTIRQVHLVADLLKRPAINIVLQPEPCLTYVPCRDTLPRHYVFIGEKIKVERTETPYYCNRISMDSRFQARYKILANAYGSFPNDTIQFTAYDHYGTPAFSERQVVLLFVSEHCQELIHQKYQYYPLYKTVDNKWASPYAALDYAHLPSTSAIKPRLIKFREPVVYNISDTNDPEWVARTFPAPYYRIENKQVIAVYGNYVDELVELKKQTVLKERGVVLK